MRNPVKVFLSVPHRPYFLLGTIGMVAIMAWWLIQLAHPAAAIVPPGWVHAWLMVYGVFSPFVFGFLFTAMPRWTSAPAPSRATWLSAWLLKVSGLGTVVIGIYVSRSVAAAGWGLVLLAWVIGLTAAFRVWTRGENSAVHTPSTLLSLLLGAGGVAAILAWHLGGQWQWSFLGMRLGFWGFLFILYVTVCHRMIPFFASCVLSDYRIYRPTWALVTLVSLGAVHMVLDLGHAYHLLWIADALMGALVVWLAFRWQFWRSRGIRLLSSLFLAWCVLAVGLAISVVQSAWLAWTGEFILGRAPQHVIGIGFFGGMLMAMATRVTLGHSGRPLAMDRLTWWCLVAIQGAALSRLLSEVPVLSAAARPLLIASALTWVIAAFVWAVRYAPIYLRPRADNAPG